MFGLLFALLIIDGILLMVVILLQAGKGGGLAAMGGAGTSTDSFIGGRQAAGLLTKTTWTSAAIFLGLSLVLSIMSTQGGDTTDSILSEEFQESAPAAPQPILPGLEEDGEAAPQQGTDAGGTQSAEPEPVPIEPGELPGTSN